jgi:cytochrome c biogenesis protein CcmG, thiol:disulfide interchange protein DsbE
MFENPDTPTERVRATTSESSVPPESRGGRIVIFGRGMSIGALLAWVGVLTLLVITAFGLLRSREEPFSIGQTTPAFVLTTFDGEQINSRDLSGKVLVINFWSSWCKPCEEEAPDLEDAWQYYQPRGDVLFLGIGYVDTRPEALSYINRFGITYPNGPDQGQRISNSFRIRGVPETYIIDGNGVLANAKIGPFRNLAEIKSMVEPLLEP